MIKFWWYLNKSVLLCGYWPVLFPVCSAELPEGVRFWKHRLHRPVEASANCTFSFLSLWNKKKNHHNSSLKGSKLGWIVSENLSCLISLSEKTFRIFLQFLTLYFNSAWLNVFKHIFFGLFHLVLLKRAVCSSLCRSGHCKDELPKEMNTFLRKCSHKWAFLTSHYILWC